MRYRFLPRIVFALICTSLITTVQADDLIVNPGENKEISSSRDLSDMDQYENDGTVKITTDGVLNIADGVMNAVSPGEGIEGLNLGVVDSSGTINADMFIRFQKGSTIGGSLIATGNNIAFDGMSTITGNVEAKQLILNAAKDATALDYFLIDLTGDNAKLDVEELVVKASTKINTKTDTPLTLDTLYIDETGTELLLSDGLTVTENYTGMSGTTIKTGMDEKGNYTGIITLLGGGVSTDDVNNYIAQDKIHAGELQVKNNTAIVNKLEVTGDFRVLEGDTADTPSRVFLDAALKTRGKVTVENNGILLFDLDETDSSVYHTYGYYNYSGVFLGGLYMEEGSAIKVADVDDDEDKQVIKLALGNASQIAEGATINAGGLSLSGVDADTNGEVQTVENKGSIDLTGELQLSNITMSNVGTTSSLVVNSIKMTGDSILEIKDGATLTFSENGLLDIGAKTQVSAAGTTLDFTGVEIINKNTAASHAIIADRIILGDGASIRGGGYYDTSATFGSGSTLYLNTNRYYFEEGDITFEKDSVISITISSDTVYPLITKGTITMQEGVILEIDDKVSSYTGRTRQFQLLSGDKDSTFTDLKLEESLFFVLNQTIDDKAGGLWVEIIKVNELVDYADSTNQKNLSTMIDKLLNDNRVSAGQKEVFNALMKIASDSAFRQGLNELSGATRENAVIYALSAPWERSFNSIGFNRLSLALPTPYADADDPTLRGQKKSWLPNVSKPKWNRPRWSFSHDLWAETYYDYTKFSDDGNAPGGHGNRGGFYAGTALPSPSRESLLGISVGYSAGEYKQSHDKVDLDDLQLGIYGGVNLFSRNLQLRGYVGYGMQDYKYKRNVQVGNYLPIAVSGKTDGDSISAAIYLVRPMDMSPRYLFKPMIGFDLERLSQDGFSESGAAAVALSYEDVTLNRVMWRIGASGDYEYSDRTELNWRFLAGLKVSGDNTVHSTHRFMSPGDDPFEIRSINLGDYAFDFGFGGNWKLNPRRTVLLFLDYNGNFTKNTNTHTSSLGILWKR